MPSAINCKTRVPSWGHRILLQVGVPSAHGWSCGAYVLIDGTIALIAAFTCGAKPAPAGRSLWAPAGGIRSDLALGVYSIVFGILLLGCRAPRSEGQGGWGDLQLIQS